MQEPIAGRRSAQILVYASALMLLAGLVLALFGNQWLLVLTVATLVVFAIAQYRSWSFALGGGLISLLAAVALAMPVYPLFHLGLEWSNVVLAVVLAAVAWAALWRKRATLRLPARSSQRLFIYSAIVPVLGLAYIAETIVRHGTSAVSWAMTNDNVWNTVASRFLIIDGGLLPSSHTNSAPFANELMASAMAPGRARIAIPALLRHDIVSEIVLWLILTLLMCFLCGFILAKVVAPERKVLRLVAALLGGMIPLTWYVTGYAFQLGFPNVTITVVVLFSIWIVWSDAASQPYLSVCVFLLATTVLLAVWAPLAVIPVALLVASLILNPSSVRSAVKLPFGLLFWFAVLQLIAYVAYLTIPDFGRDGSALGAGVIAVPVTAANIILGASVAFAITALGAIGRADIRPFVGTTAIIAGSSASILYLSSRSEAIGGWGYYASKLSWILSILLLAIIASSTLSWLNDKRVNRVTAVAVLISSGLLAGVVAAQVLPVVGWNLRGVFPESSIGRPGGISDRDQEAAFLFSISDPRKKSMVVRYFPNPTDDLFVNGWLLQHRSKSGNDKLRTYAYFFDTTNNNTVCKVVAVWGGGVDIYTRDPGLEAELDKACPDEKFTVVLRS